jgi:hypothetical protein
MIGHRAGQRQPLEAPGACLRFRGLAFCRPGEGDPSPSGRRDRSRIIARLLEA